MEEASVRHRGLIVLCSVLSLIAGGLIGFFTPHPRDQPIAIVTPDPTATPSPTPTPGPLRVYVSGAVNAPAVYLLPGGSLARDAVAAAGGPRADADLDHVNLAQELTDQQQVHVPWRGEEGEAAPLATPAQAASTEGALVNINVADLAELETLPGIGPATAQSIIDYREAYGPFEEIEELLEVPGIGTATLEGIRDRAVTR
jgi:competence protein ComEA